MKNLFYYFYNFSLVITKILFYARDINFSWYLPSFMYQITSKSGNLYFDWNIIQISSNEYILNRYNSLFPYVAYLSCKILKYSLMSIQFNKYININGFVLWLILYSNIIEWIQFDRYNSLFPPDIWANKHWYQYDMYNIMISINANIIQ